MEDSAVVFVIADKDGVPVTLTRRQWEEHILVGHPNMARHLEALKQAIADPDYILQSDRRTDTRLLYRLGATEGRFSDLYVVAVVRYTAQEGFVRTAYLAFQPVAGGKVLWIRARR